MSVQMVLLPVFVLVGLSFALLFWTGRGKLGGRVDTPAASDALADPLQLSLLFYVLIALALPLRRVDLIMVLLSWVFVATRFVHAGVFAAAGGAGQRSMAYLSSALVLLAMWLYFALRLLLLL
jgi:hypothetical protein